MLERELGKIHDFQKKKAEELSASISNAEKQVYELVREEESRRLMDPTDLPGINHEGDVEGLRHTSHDDDGGSEDDLDSDDGFVDDASSTDIDARFHTLKLKVAELVADVHDLALYSKLNFTGFEKILKVSAFSHLCVPMFMFSIGLLPIVGNVCD